MVKITLIFILMIFSICLLVSCVTIDPSPSPSPTGPSLNTPITSEENREVTLVPTTENVSPSPSPTLTPSPKTKEEIDMAYVLSLDSTSHRGTPVSIRYQNMIEQYGGIYQKHKEKSICLTYNLGDELGYTNKLLDKLKQYNIKATFFLLDAYIQSPGNKSIIKRMIDEGHIVGSHGVTHVDHSNLSVWTSEQVLVDLKKIQTQADKVLDNYTIKYYRPPYGYFNERNLYMAKELGLTSVFWTFTYEDWTKDKHDDIDYVFNLYMKNLKDGMVTQLHVSNNNNIDVLDRFVKAARDKGYEFYSLDD